MSLALFERNETDYEKQDQDTNADENYNGEYTGRPFKYGSSFHSFATGEHRSNTDYKPACSRFRVGARPRSVNDGYSNRWPEVSVFSHELLNLVYDTIEFVDEI